MGRPLRPCSVWLLKTNQPKNYCALKDLETQSREKTAISLNRKRFRTSRSDCQNTVLRHSRVRRNRETITFFPSKVERIGTQRETITFFPLITAFTLDVAAKSEVNKALDNVLF